MQATSDLEAANRAYYAALSARDLAAMERLWAQTPDVTNIAPPTRPVAHTGWPAVRANYERFWSSLARLTVTMEKPIVTIHGDVGWVHGIENTQRIGVSGETSGGRNFGTSIFVRHDARWRMVFHQAAPMPD
jgi:ketosteroid isomerase-like protein